MEEKILTIKESSLINLCDSIRDKEGTSELIRFSDIAPRIKNLKGVPKIVNGMKLQGSSYIPDNIDTSSVTDMTYMFATCNKLTTIPQLDTSSVTTMQSMFATCTKLTTIPQLNTSSVTTMRDMFSNCNELTTIPQLDTSSVNNMQSMFSYCSKLTTIPQLDTSSVNNMYNMFSYCNELTTIPQLDTSSVNNMQSMFSYCDSLSRESINNILGMCVNAKKITNATYKTLKYIGVPQALCVDLDQLPNWQAFVDAGWTIGY